MEAILACFARFRWQATIRGANHRVADSALGSALEVRCNVLLEERQTVYDAPALKNVLVYRRLAKLSGKYPESKDLLNSEDPGPPSIFSHANPIRVLRDDSMQRKVGW